MESTKSISVLFWIAGVYDGLLGLVFLFFGMRVMGALQIAPPNHVGYFQFPAALLIIFALIFFAIARNPIANRQMIWYGVLLKIAYCTIVFGHWVASGLPWIWKPFAFADALWIVLFVWAYSRLKKMA